MPGWLDDAIDIAKSLPPIPGLGQSANLTASVYDRLFKGDVTPERAENYIKAVMSARKHGVPEQVMIGILSAEGSFWADPKGNLGGIGQFTSDTAKDYGTTPEELRKNPDKAIDIVGQHLEKLGKYFNNDWQKASAAYFIGPGGVEAAQKGQGSWLDNADVISQKYKQGSVTEYLNKAGVLTGVQGTASLRNQSAEDIMKSLGLNKPTQPDSLKNYNPAKLPAYKDFLVSDATGSYFDSDGFKAALDLHKQYQTDDKEAYERTVGPISQYVDDIVSEYSAQIAAGKLDVAKATSLFEARTKSMETAYKQYDSDSFKYAAPTGKAFIPGREPGGLFSGMGLSPLASDRSTTIDPLGDAARNYNTYETGLNSVRFPGVPDIANQRRNALIMASGGGTTYPFGSSPPIYGPPAPTGPATGGPGLINSGQVQEQTLLEQLLAAGMTGGY